MKKRKEQPQVRFFKLRSDVINSSSNDNSQTWEEIWQLNTDGSYSVLQFYNINTGEKKRYNPGYLRISLNIFLGDRIKYLEPLTEQEAFIELL